MLYFKGTRTRNRNALVAVSLESGLYMALPVPSYATSDALLAFGELNDRDWSTARLAVPAVTNECHVYFYYFYYIR